MYFTSMDCSVNFRNKCILSKKIFCKWHANFKNLIFIFILHFFIHLEPTCFYSLSCKSTNLSFCWIRFRINFLKYRCYQFNSEIKLLLLNYFTILSYLVGLVKISFKHFPINRINILLFKF